MTPQIHLTSWDQSKDSEVDSGRGSGPGQPEAPPPTLGISLGNPSSMSQPRRLCLAPTGWHCPQLSPAPSESAPSPNGMIHLARFHRLKSQTHARLPPGNVPSTPEHGSSGSSRLLHPLTHSQTPDPAGGEPQPGQRCDLSRQPRLRVLIKPQHQDAAFAWTPERAGRRESRHAPGG